MKWTKRATTGLAAVMAASALGTASISAAAVETASAEPMAANEVTYQVSTSCAVTHGTDIDSTTLDVDAADYKITTDGDLSYAINGADDGLVYTVTVADDAEAGTPISCKLSVDGTSAKLLMSKDGGKTWQKFPIHMAMEEKSEK